jgi:hypothetical protein
MPVEQNAPLGGINAHILRFICLPEGRFKSAPTRFKEETTARSARKPSLEYGAQSE